MGLGVVISGVGEVVGAFGRRDGAEDRRDSIADRPNGSLCGFAQLVLNLAKSRSIGFRSGEDFRQAEELAARDTDGVTRGVSFVRADILHQPCAVRPCNLLWPIAVDLARLDAAGLVEALHPVDRRVDAYPKLGRRLMP
jgi:hypothetical protein